MKNAAEDRQTKATETVDCLMDSKNNTQCAAVRSPVAQALMAPALGRRIGPPTAAKYTKRPKTAISIRYQTNVVAGSVISFPRTAVNPKTTTMRCSQIWYLTFRVNTQFRYSGSAPSLSTMERAP